MPYDENEDSFDDADLPEDAPDDLYQDLIEQYPIQNFMTPLEELLTYEHTIMGQPLKLKVCNIVTMGNLTTYEMKPYEVSATRNYTASEGTGIKFNPRAWDEYMRKETT